MAAKTVDTQAKENLQWVVSLRTPGISKDDLLKIYSNWVEKANFDSDVLSRGYEAPVLTVKYLCESIPKEKRSEMKILDIGAGTGLVAKGLRAEGFRQIDALDASDAMLSMAKKGDLYENYFCEFMSDTPVERLDPDSYDGVTAAGCFIPNHIPPEALREIIRIVNPGGIVVIVSSAVYMTTSPEFKDRLLPLIDTLEQQGKWKKLVSETTGVYFLQEEAVVWKYQVLEKSKE